MKKDMILIALLITALGLSGCTQNSGSMSDKDFSGAVNNAAKGLEFVSVADDDPLYYLDITAAEASSFDQTPDWAPEPDPMAPADGDMLTRWSSDYQDSRDWIYFDLGKERVISEVIIYWERAYATKYTIEVSGDASDWKAVFNQSDFTGGMDDAVFPAVKCRYVRIKGQEKVEENWGISIWEVEIYGPVSHNPGARVSKQERLSKGKEEEKKKEAEAIIEKLASPVAPISEKPFQQGVIYTSWMSDELLSPASDITLTSLKKMGFDTIGIMVPAYQDELDSKKVFTNDKAGGDTPTDEALAHAIDVCHKLGLRVMLKPHVDPRTDEARINIIASEEWFDSYEAFILRYAIFSAKHKVEIFSIGTELEATTFEAWAARWDQLIAKVRGAYRGVLTYSANWTEYKEVPFWGEMDFIGIDAYFPLTEKDDPTIDELKASWGKHADEIEAWLKEKGLTDKGIVLTEVGYTSTDGANRQPWAAISKREDQQEQADCLEATFDVLSKRPWFKGYYMWQYFPQERWSPLGFTINKKKADPVMREWLEKLASRKPVVQVAAESIITGSNTTVSTVTDDGLMETTKKEEE